MRKTFSITDKEVLERLEHMDNQSNYIQTLILRDIYDPCRTHDYENGILTAAKYMQITIDMIKRNAEDSMTK